MNAKQLAAERALIKAAVDSANEFAKVSRDIEDVKAVIAANDVVIAVWQEPAERDGVGWLLIKGQQLMRNSVASGASIRASLAGVPCREAAEAHALLQVVGERDRSH